MFSNLLENTVRHADCDKVRIDTKEQNRKAVVNVDDDGQGIPGENKDKIFKRGSKKGEASGSGLRMYLAKQIIESYNSSIEVKDSEHGGVRFDVTLKKA